MLRSLFRLAGRRLARSLATFPTLLNWAEAVVLLAAFAAIAVPAGIAVGLLEFEMTKEPVHRLLLAAAIAFLVPSLFEETIYRAILMPHRTETRSTLAILAATAVSVTLFVLGHPLVGLLVPSTRELFFDLRFLALAGLFGVTCSLAYLRTGSIWVCVFLHWSIVVGWVIFFGGWIFALGPR